MGNDDILTDDYVAEMLAKEANSCSLKYSSLGLEAYRESKPANKAKPNTRFLRHIIKETKNHNEALLAKEAAESQARLNELAEAEEKKRRRLRPAAGDVRRRQLGDIAAILQGRKRKRGEGEAKRSQDSTAGDRKQKDLGEKPGNGDRGRGSASDGGSRRDKEPGRHHKDRRREESDEDGRRRRRRRSHDQDRSRSPGYRERRHRHRSPLDDDKDDSKHRSGGRRHDRSTRRRNGSASPHDKKRSRKTEEEDSDPLEDLIGPRPPSQPVVRPRGRGVASGGSAMDGRFSDSYDPKSDVQLDPDEADDWDEALEALRDRQKWKQQGADRLRAAGFTEEQVKKWENGDEKNVQDVRWAKAGEGREWDRGKSPVPR
ncbi:hypothetical protein QBC33DRAFT_366632 [Phialemonium atrogriseum]|uniref:Pre-mRNA-splicing factor 38B n=1 Tax=Phialemonium atrogriseum TaxID=1093897 RepID=A0AAJ0C2V4_9PEZI|nr:uncharacterized protein QBC33DRAFT_366632 [Phialemonium atrogriseum]KAK1768925.1 hypothetical protein QBC33DRAFT_366632 [Phialemonium atrogriseum]